MSLAPCDEEIRTEAAGIRKGLETAVSKGLLSSHLRTVLADFPRGCCGNVACALAQHLSGKLGVDAQVITV